MFDLFRSRQTTVRYLLGALLGLVALSLVITLIPGYGGGTFGGSRDDQLIAEIGDEVLTVTEVRQVIARELRGKRIPQGMESIFIPMLVQQMIAERAVAYQAQRMGFQLSEQELSETIAGLIPQLFEGGKFVGRETYAAVLAQQNMTIAQFESSVRKQAASTKLETLALEGVIVTPAEVEEEFKRRSEKVKLAYFALTPDRFRAQAAATPAEIEAAYERMKSGLQRTERRAYLVFPIEEKAIAATVSVDETALRQAYTSQLDHFRTPERVRVSHILLMTTDKSKEEVEQIRKRAEGLLKQVRSGGNFAEIARKNSEDPGSAVKGGDLDWIVKGQTVPEFEKTAFSMKPGQISDIVTTMYGFHILKLDEKEEARVRPFEEVRAELRAELARSRVYDRMQGLADQIRAALLRSPAEAEQIARDAGVTPVRVEPTPVGDPIPVPGIGANPSFNEAVASLSTGGVTPVIQVGDERLVVAQVIGIEPVRQMTLTEAMDRVRAQVVNEKAENLLQDRVREAEERIKLANGDIAAVARQFGVTLQTSAALGREDNLDAVGSMMQVEEVFSKQPGEVVGPVRTAAGAAFIKVLEHIPADLTALAAQRQQVTDGIKQRRARERRELFTEGLVNQLTREKKLKVYEENVKRLASAYRG